MVKYPNAASGIKKVFLAKIIGVIGVPLAFIPGIGALLLMTCTVAATIFNVWGILEASKDHNGDHVWNVNKTCLIVMAVCLVVAFIPILNILAAITSLIVAVVTIYASVVYLIYLYQSGQYLSLNTHF